MNVHVSALQTHGDVIRSSIAELDKHWKAAQQLLARRFDGIASEDLRIRASEHHGPAIRPVEAKDGRIDLPTALAQLALSGMCNAALREWIKEDLGAQGISRWHNAFAGHLRDMVDTCHRELFPAIDGAAVSICRLRAALTLRDLRSDPATPSLAAATSRPIDAALNDLDVLRLLSSALLAILPDELTRALVLADFLALKARQFADPTSESARDAALKLADIDLPLLLASLGHGDALGAQSSAANIFLGRDADAVQRAPRRPRLAPARPTVEAMLRRHAASPQQPVGGVVEYVNLPYVGLFLVDCVGEIVAALAADGDGEHGAARDPGAERAEARARADAQFEDWLGEEGWAGGEVGVMVARELELIH